MRNRTNGTTTTSQPPSSKKVKAPANKKATAVSPTKTDATSTTTTTTATILWLALSLLVNIGVVALVNLWPKLHMPIYHTIGIFLGLGRLLIGFVVGTQNPLLNNTIWYIQYFRYLSQIPMSGFKLGILAIGASKTPHLLWADIFAHAGSSLLWFTRYYWTPYAKKQLQRSNTERNKMQLWVADSLCFRLFCENWGFKCAVYILHSVWTGNVLLLAEAVAEFLATNNNWMRWLNITTTNIGVIGGYTLTYSALKVLRYATR